MGFFFSNLKVVYAVPALFHDQVFLLVYYFIGIVKTFLAILAASESRGFRKKLIFIYLIAHPN